MPSVPFAAFLVGALLTILLPLALLIALAVWYWKVSVRVPETTVDIRTRDANPPRRTSGPRIPETLPPEPGA